LLVSADVAVLIAAFIAAWFVLRLGRRFFKRGESNDDCIALVAPVTFFFAFLALLLVAYLTHQQPIIFPRYGLILFILGLPILAWTFLKLRTFYPQFARKVLVSIVVICALDAGIQFVGAVGTINQYRTQRAVADYLRDHFDPNSGARIFCDEGTVRVLSGIPEDRFITSSLAPRDDFAFRSFLEVSHVDYLIVADVQGSALAKLMRRGEAPSFDGFETAFHSRSAFLPTDIWLLRTSRPKK
jgi:hypothetical protein